jgi:hypothetical protein
VIRGAVEHDFANEPKSQTIRSDLFAVEEFMKKRARGIGKFLPMLLALCWSSEGISQTSPNTVMFEVVEYRNVEESLKRSIFMNIPGDFTYGSSASINKGYGINLLTWLSNFKSASALENREFGLQCGGYCNGRVLLSIRNDASYIPKEYATKADFLVRKFFENNKYGTEEFVKKEIKIENSFGFTDAYDEFHQSDFPKHLITQYLFHRIPSKSTYDQFATCHPEAPFPGCSFTFSLDCEPSLSVSVSVVRYADMVEATEIQRKVNRFLTPFILTERCQKK